VRSLTVYLVRTKSLSKYCYLEHGAYWAIGFLAVCLLVSEKYHIPEVVTGGFAVIVIAAALLSSIYFGTVEQESMDEDETDDEPTAGTPDQQLALHLNLDDKYFYFMILKFRYLLSILFVSNYS
jgi:hypothetical protein